MLLLLHVVGDADSMSLVLETEDELKPRDLAALMHDMTEAQAWDLEFYSLVGQVGMAHEPFKPGIRHVTRFHLVSVHPVWRVVAPPAIRALPIHGPRNVSAPIFACATCHRGCSCQRGGEGEAPLSSDARECMPPRASHFILFVVHAQSSSVYKVLWFFFNFKHINQAPDDVTNGELSSDHDSDGGERSGGGHGLAGGRARRAAAWTAWRGHVVDAWRLPSDDEGGEGGAFGDDRGGGDHGRGGDHEAESGGVAQAKARPKAKAKVVAARGSRDEPWGPFGLAKVVSGGNRIGWGCPCRRHRNKDDPNNTICKKACDVREDIPTHGHAVSLAAEAVVDQGACQPGDRLGWPPVTHADAAAHGCGSQHTRG